MTVATDIQLVGVPYSSLDSVWEEVKPKLQRGIDLGDGELNVDDILKFLVDRSMQLWVLYDYLGDKIVMAGVTEVVVYARKKVCRAVVLGGDGLDAWVGYIDQIEAWAKTKDCNQMEAFGRRGLAKKMEAIGYQNKYVVIRKDL